MKQPTDQQNFDLADLVYEDDSLNINGKPIELTDHSKWVVINSVNEPSGLQAIAVVSLKDYTAMKAGKIQEYPNIIFSARGSQTDSWSEAYKDWIGTDFDRLTLGMKPSDAVSSMGLNVSGDRTKPAYNKEMDIHAPEHVEMAKNLVSNHQFLGMERFVNETLFDYEAKDYSFTGHSLGGALAQYMAAIKDKGATTFAAARAYRLLPPDIQKMVDSGYFDGKIVDYRHEWDPVGHVPFGNVIGSRHLVRTSSFNIAVLGHTRGSFNGVFGKGGSIQILFDPENLRILANQMMVYHDQVVDIQVAFRQYRDFEDDEIQTYVNKTRSGSEYPDLETHEIDDILRGMFPYKKSGVYSVLDPNLAEDVDLYCRLTAEKLYQFSTQLDKVVKKAEDAEKKLTKEVTDNNINWFSSLDVSEKTMSQSSSGVRPIEN